MYRQLPASGVNSAMAITGVTRAPTLVPLCSKLLPNVRWLGGKMVCVVLSAQGQCPASKMPSSVRQTSSPANVSTSPVQNPIADHSNNTTG
jgi:hypothetical protein